MARRYKARTAFLNHAFREFPFCQWCNLPLTRELATADHIIPRANGGSNDWSNLVISCPMCNLLKGNNLWPDHEYGPTWKTPYFPNDPNYQGA